MKSSFKGTTARSRPKSEEVVGAAVLDTEICFDDGKNRRILGVRFARVQFESNCNVAVQTGRRHTSADSVATRLARTWNCQVKTVNGDRRDLKPFTCNLAESLGALAAIDNTERLARERTFVFDQRLKGAAILTICQPHGGQHMGNMSRVKGVSPGAPTTAFSWNTIANTWKTLRLESVIRRKLITRRSDVA